MQEINKEKGDRKTSPSPHLITRYRLGSRDGVIQRESNHERNIEYRGQSRSRARVGGSRGCQWCRDVRLLSLGTIITDPVVSPHAETPLLASSYSLTTGGHSGQVTAREKQPKQRFNQKHRDPNCLHLVENKNNLRIH